MKRSTVNKKALVTGGTRGIGRAIAALLCQRGYEVTVTGTHPTPQGPTGTSYLSCDFSDTKATGIFAREVGQMGFSVLINNAGINKIGPVSDYDDTDFARIQQVNVAAPFMLCKALVPGMQRRRFGRIVNITSIYSVVSRAGRSAYSASKFGLFGLARALALEVAKDNVLVNCLAPGFVDTELSHNILGEKGVAEMTQKIPVGRFAKPEEIAKYVVFLASDENTYMTGQNIVVDGGFTCE